MSESILSVIADSSLQPIAVVGSDGQLMLANKALRLLVDEAQLLSGFHRTEFDRGFTLPTRTGGDVVFEVISDPNDHDSWVLRGEVASRRVGLAEEAKSFEPVSSDGQTILGLHLARAGQRALEQDRSVALFLLEFLGLEHVVRDNGQEMADQAAACLDERLRSNLRAVDIMMPQDDGTRAVVAVVSNADGAGVVASRLSSALARPLAVNGIELVFGARIGMAYCAGSDLNGLQPAARAALEQAEHSKRLFFSLAGGASD